MSYRLAVSACALAVSLGLPAQAAIEQLPSYHVDPNKVFVAGVSSGGSFAVQMDVAHSQTFKGAAIYAGGVYYCAQGSVEIALSDCGGMGLYQSRLAASEAYLDANSSQGTIDPESALRGQTIYLWSGTHDSLVKQQAVDDLRDEYAHYGANVTYENSFPAEHGWESPDSSLACGRLASPFTIACRNGSVVYDSEQTWLTLFFGPLHPRNGGTLAGSLLRFDQKAFGANDSNSLDSSGYVFVPQACAQGESCGLVVAFHGCKQTQADIGAAFATESGIDEWADTNGIIVLYPYAAASPTMPTNPNGCWDWWGYDDRNYALKSGTQVAIVYKMVQRLMGSP